VKFLIQRLYRNEMLHDEDMIFEDMMRDKYPKEFDCGKKIAKYIEVETNSKITRMEMTYLAIHIKRVTMAEE
jgi:transcription antiterminator licT